MVLESEKSEGDRTIETLRIRNEELRRKYEQLIIDNDHRIHVEEHVREMNEMKRLTGKTQTFLLLFCFHSINFHL